MHHRWIVFAIRFWTSGGGVGYLPLAPGTWGSLLACGMVYVMGGLSWGGGLALVLVLTLISGWVCQWDQKVSGVSDPGRIVIDEILGIFVTALGFEATPHHLFWIFVTFRFFDIVKFPPCHWIDSKLKNGWGVIGDDLVAGVYAHLLVSAIMKSQLV